MRTTAFAAPRLKDALRYRAAEIRQRARERGSLGALSRHRDVLAMQALAALDVGFVPWSTMAMRPQGLLTVLNDISLNQRRQVVECGAGVSTIHIAKLLATVGEGHLHTVEHDGGWAEMVRGMVQRRGLEAVCTVAIAPLEPAGSPTAWYSSAVLDGLGLNGVDLLLVDGPVAYTRARRHARRPALEYFHDKLAADCTVVLDDITRRGEQEVVAAWEAAYHISFEQRPYEGGIAVWRRGGPAPFA